MERTNCIIIDLEGTLTDCRHRIKYYLNGEYDKWRDNFVHDLPNKNFLHVLQKEKENGTNIIISTAKSIEDSKEVYDWLESYKLPNGDKINSIISMIYYRSIGDDRPSVEVKRDHLKLIKNLYVVIHAYDDREDILNMFNENNIFSTRITASGDIQPYYTPLELEEEEKEEKEKDSIIFIEEVLKGCIEVFKSRNKEYDNSYIHFGKTMVGHFTKGVLLESESDFSRFAILTTIASKLDRYAKNFSSGGHHDSLLDIINYCAMLIELDMIESKK